MPDSYASPVPDDLVNAAIHASTELGKDVADVPLIAIARQAGVSRSTLLRRIGGSRGALDAAVSAAGVDPGGRRPVRARATDAAAHIISHQGLAETTLEAVADTADCSVHSLYATFGGRDELLRAVFERYSPVLDVEKALSGPHGDLRATVHGLYRLLADGFGREPRVLPAMLADCFARPHGPTVTIMQEHFFPRMLAGLGGWLAEEVTAGRVRDLPLPLLMQQLLGPAAVHFMLRPVLTEVPGVDMPDPEHVCQVLTDTFLRAVTTEPTPGSPT